MKRAGRWLGVAAIILLLIGLFAAYLGDTTSPTDIKYRAQLAKALSQGKEFELYSIYADNGPLPPQGKADAARVGSEKMGGWPILGKTVVSDEKLRSALIGPFADSARCFGDGSCMRPACFQPRHAIRVTHEGATLELLICFECRQVQVKGDFPAFLIGTDSEPAFDALLKNAGITLSRTLEKKMRTPPELFDAAQSGRKEEVARLLGAGADLSVRWNGNTPLHEAAWKGHHEVVALLLDAGAPIQASGMVGRTPLHEAAYGGHLEAVKLLLARKADVNAKDNSDDTPLHLATYRGNLQVITLLLEHGADPNAPNKHHGSTPLHIAGHKGDPDVVKVILAKGGDPGVRSSLGKTPLEDARAPLNDQTSPVKRREVVRLLESATAAKR